MINKVHFTCTTTTRRTKDILWLIYGIASSILIMSCSAGSSSSNAVVRVPTFNYNPGNKTATMISVGGGSPIIAELDTGSEMTVVNESYIGNNIIKTTESLSITYGAGTNTVSGYIAYGSITFTTQNGDTLSTSKSTPILVVNQGSVNQGGGNNAVLGLRMNNQISSRLFLPYPYNQMMVLNRNESYVAFGNLTANQLSKFALISQETVACDNLGINYTNGISCWNMPQKAVTYQYSLGGGNYGESNYVTILDSGEARGNIYLAPRPDWISLDNNGMVLNQVQATLNTNHGSLRLPITSPLYYKQPLTSPGAINPGNLLFNTYQVLFDQQSGQMGFRASNESW